MSIIQVLKETRDIPETYMIQEVPPVFTSNIDELVNGLNENFGIRTDYDNVNDRWVSPFELEPSDVAVTPMRRAFSDPIIIRR